MANAPKPNETETGAGTTTGGNGGEQNNGGTTESKEKGVAFTPEQQAELNRIVAAERKAAENRAKQEITEKAEREKLEQQGEYKTLLEKAKAEIATLKQTIADLELDKVRTNVGRKVGIPESMWGRLHGATESEIEADAKSIKADLDKQFVNRDTSNEEHKGTPPGGKGGNGDADSLEKRKQELAATGAYVL